MSDREGGFGGTAQKQVRSFIHRNIEPSAAHVLAQPTKKTMLKFGYDEPLERCGPRQTTGTNSSMWAGGQPRGAFKIAVIFSVAPGEHKSITTITLI